MTKLIKRIGCFGVFSMATIVVSASVSAQSIEQVRWKSEQQVSNLLGKPQSKSTPTGTHASYTLWKYDDFTVAFANNRAFHLFKKDSLKKVVLEENRPN